jgi:hypothetical protein
MKRLMEFDMCPTMWQHTHVHTCNSIHHYCILHIWSDSDRVKKEGLFGIVPCRLEKAEEAEAGLCFTASPDPEPEAGES